MAQILGYPFPASIVGDSQGTAIAYVLDERGVRSLWFAAAPAFTPHQLFSSSGDDGQELSDLTISADDAHVVYVRGGDHDANWPEPLQPGPDSSPVQPEMQVWSVATSGSTPKLLGNGDAPAISPDGMRVAFTIGGAVMIVPIDGSAAAKRMFFDRGQDSELQWSPDGSALAFASDRTDHSFIGIFDRLRMTRQLCRFSIWRRRHRRTSCRAGPRTERSSPSSVCTATAGLRRTR